MRATSGDRNGHDTLGHIAGDGVVEMPAARRAQGTILEIGISTMSVAPRSISSGMSTLIVCFGATVSTA